MQLREEDLIPGRRFVHPQTRLEYEDFHAWFCGKDPLPHWRNARIKGVHAGEEDRHSCDREERIRTYLTCYSRDGHPFATAV